MTSLDDKIMANIDDDRDGHGHKTWDMGHGDGGGDGDGDGVGCECGCRDADGDGKRQWQTALTMKSDRVMYGCNANNSKHAQHSTAQRQQLAPH